MRLHNTIRNMFKILQAVYTISKWQKAYLIYWRYTYVVFLDGNIPLYCRSQWSRGLTRRRSVARLLRLWVRIPPEAWMFFCCLFCVLSGRGLCDKLITRPEESYRMWRVVVCDLETSNTRTLKPATGLWKYNHRVVTPGKQTIIPLYYITQQYGPY